MPPFATIREAKEWSAEQLGTSVCFLLGSRYPVKWYFERITGRSTSCRAELKERSDG